MMHQRVIGNAVAVPANGKHGAMDWLRDAMIEWHRLVCPTHPGPTRQRQLSRSDEMPVGSDVVRVMPQSRTGRFALKKIPSGDLAFPVAYPDSRCS